MVMDIKRVFSARLNEALDDMDVPRKGKGRQKKVQEIFRSHGGTVSENGARKWLQAESIPAMENLILLARALNVGVEWLATGRGPKWLLSAEAYQVAMDFDGLDRD